MPFEKGKDRYRALEHTGQCGGCDHLVFVCEVLKRLVAHEHEVVVDNDFGESFERGTVEDGGGGVIGVREEHHLGFWV